MDECRRKKDIDKESKKREQAYIALVYLNNDYNAYTQIRNIKI